MVLTLPEECLDAFLKEMKAGFHKEGFIRGGMFGMDASQCQHYLLTKTIFKVVNHDKTKESPIHLMQ